MRYMRKVRKMNVVRPSIRNVHTAYYSTDFY